MSKWDANEPRERAWLFNTTSTVDMHRRELRFLRTNVPGKKKKLTITIIISHATRIKGDVTAFKKLKECLHKKYNENQDPTHKPRAAFPLGISTGNN
jgi:hypothetical protein